VPGVIYESDRGQVLDGIIRYGNEIAIIFESKLDGNADDRQARNINLHGQPVAFDGTIRRISWRDILATFTDLASEDRGITSGAERLLLTDFLSFVDTNFSRLGPFSTLRRCEGEPSRIYRRLNAILNEALSTDGNLLPGTHTAVITAYLDYIGDSRHIKLHMYPADTLQQARIFYDRPNIIELTLRLENEGWKILPCFHFGFMAKGFGWTTTALPIGEYLRYWRKHIENATQVGRENWNTYWDELIKARIASPADREQFDFDFTNTDRQSASPRPGLNCSFMWSLEEAEKLDAQGKMAKSLKDRINQLLEAIGEHKIGA
jgi:hypothetical protein